MMQFKFFIRQLKRKLTILHTLFLIQIKSTLKLILICQPRLSILMKFYAFLLMRNKIKNSDLPQITPQHTASRPFRSICCYIFNFEQCVLLNSGLNITKDFLFHFVLILEHTILFSDEIYQQNTKLFGNSIWELYPKFYLILLRREDIQICLNFFSSQFHTQSHQIYLD